MVQKMEDARTQLEALSDDQLLGEGLVARLRCATYIILSVFLGLNCRGIRLHETTR
jgi:hypothetical protein